MLSAASGPEDNFQQSVGSDSTDEGTSGFTNTEGLNSYRVQRCERRWRCVRRSALKELAV